MEEEKEEEREESSGEGDERGEEEEWMIERSGRAMTNSMVELGDILSSIMGRWRRRKGEASASTSSLAAHSFAIQSNLCPLLAALVVTFRCSRDVVTSITEEREIESRRIFCPLCAGLFLLCSIE